MGHQFSFFWSDEETFDTLSMLAEIEDLVLLERRSYTSEPKAMQVDDVISLRSAPWLFLLARQKTVSELKLSFVETQGYWYLDTDRNPVIEVMRFPEEDNKLRIGRFYYKSTYLANSDHFVKKDDAFLKWARKVFTRAKSRFDYDKEQFAYVGEDIKKRVEEGLVLTYL